MEKESAVLCADHISKWYDGRCILKDVSLHLETGELVCLLGVSGAGKTTLFHTLSGLETPEEGQVFVSGQEITGKPGSISYMLQKDLLLPHKRMLDNVALPLVLRGESKQAAREKAQPYFAQFGLEGTEAQYPAQLSGGMRQRAALLRTFLGSRGVVLLDEPFSALDPSTRQGLYHELQEIHARFSCTIVFVTHDFNEAQLLADRIGILLDGELPAVTEAASLMQQNYCDKVEEFLGRK